MNHVIFHGTPVAPSKIVCIGRNYAEHARELNNEIPTEPVIFIKPNSAISDQLIAGTDGQIHYEGEICFLLRDQQLAGVGFGLDLTNRPLQSELKSKGLPWERAKGFDHSVVFSPFVSFEQVESLHLSLEINQQTVQAGGYPLMMFKPAALVAEISRTFSLIDGDIIMTGTPKGVGSFRPGDHFVGKIFSGTELLVQQEWIAC